ncbi:hypothetical protein JTE90_010865 [Oedothorax gibbosus]|uniref:Uncharacterized protein n=1 Tax=Oedothorax gibbosus TaxID=931172 RepID=A0AAV6V2J0_9ARAC|nr:hypothetical protein JTE90_010865 [Oedothorax gibbosus]
MLQHTVVYFVAFFLIRIPVNHGKGLESEYELMWWLVQSADWGYSTNMSAGAAAGRTFAAVAHSTWTRKGLPEGVVFADDADARVVSVVRSRVSAGYSRAAEGAAAQRMARMRSPAALRREWKAWRMRVSEPFQEDFRLLVRLTNAAAKDSGEHAQSDRSRWKK